MLLPYTVVALLLHRGALVELDDGTASVPSADTLAQGPMDLATNSVPPGIADKLERSGLVDDWGKNMQGFIPETLLTFPLAPRTVDFQITDPTGDVISEKSDQTEGLFQFMAKKKG